MHTVGLLHPWTSNVGWKTVQVFIEKKVAYNWANIVQTHNVQGSIVVGTRILELIELELQGSK